MKIKRLSSYWLCFGLIPINIYGDFLEKILGIKALFFNAAAIAVYFALCLVTGNKKEKIPKILVYFLVLNGIIAVEHFIRFGRFEEEIKQILYILLFVMVCLYSDKKGFERVKKVIVALTVPMTIDALYWYPRIKSMGYRMFNIRRYTMVDKTFYTLIFPIALIILFNWIFFEKREEKIAFGVWTCVLLFIIFGVVESKMAILAFAFTIGFEFFITRKKYKKRYLKIFLLVFGFASIIGLLLSLKIIKIPDYVVAALSFLGGKFDAVNSVYYETFFTRGEILKNGLLVWLRFPIFGVGYGGYYDYVSTQGMQNLSTGITDIESAALGVLVEGGLAYFISNVLIYSAIIKNIVVKKKYTEHWVDYVGIFTCIVFLLLGNDFMSVFYWVIIGIIFNGIMRSKGKTIR